MGYQCPLFIAISLCIFAASIVSVKELVLPGLSQHGGSTSLQKLQSDDFCILTQRLLGPSISKQSLPALVARRETGCSGKSVNFSSGQMCQISDRFIPNTRQFLSRFKQKAFCGIYSDDGNMFLSACQGTPRLTHILYLMH